MGQRSRAHSLSRPGVAAHRQGHPSLELHLIEMERLLAEGRERLSEIFDFVPTPLFTVDHSGIIREVNLAGAKLLGSERVRVLGTALASSVVAADRPLVRRQLTRCRAKTGLFSTDVRVMRRTGDVPVRLISRRALADVREAYLVAMVDMTAARRLEQEQEQLTAYQQAARESSEAKDLFIAVLSHELRAPLSAMAAAAATLDREDLPPEVVRAGTLLRRNVAAQSRLIEDVLDLTRLNRGSVQLR